MSIGNRLQKLIENKGLTAYMLANDIGVSQSTLSRILKKDAKPNNSTLQAITDYFKVDKSWFLTGDGEMKVSKKNNPLDIEAVQVNFNTISVMYVPLINQYAYGGYLSGYADPEYVHELPKIPFAADQEHKGEYLCFEAKGDSMDDGSDEAIKERDILLCRNVRKDYWKSKLHINKWDFVIVHIERGIVIKRIIKHDVENGILTLHSLNDYYEDFDVHLKDVAQILNIVDIQRKKNRR